MDLNRKIELLFRIKEIILILLMFTIISLILLMFTIISYWLVKANEVLNIIIIFYVNGSLMVVYLILEIIFQHYLNTEYDILIEKYKKSEGTKK